MNLQRFFNTLEEARYAARMGQAGKAQELLKEASTLLGVVPKVRPEKDPARSEADRETWRLAKGA